MEDLKALVELFGLTIIGENRNLLFRAGNIPTISVEGKNGEVQISKLQDRFWVTDKIDGVPMHFFGNGRWRFIIDV